MPNLLLLDLIVLKYLLIPRMDKNCYVHILCNSIYPPTKKKTILSYGTIWMKLEDILEVK